MNHEEKMRRCSDFFNVLAQALSSNYTVMGSCNKDVSAYLVPTGHEDEVSYYGKPENSFRVSDHWNWYSSLKKCSDQDEVQCHSIDIPRPRRRPEVGKASYPRKAAQVALYKDGRYQAVYGEVFDHKTKSWSWLDACVEDVAALV